MKIAVFHLGFFYSGGGEKLVLEEIRGLRARGHDVDCFAPFVDRDGCFPDIPEMKQVRTFLPDPPRWLRVPDPLWVALNCLLAPWMAWRFRGYDVFLGANQPGPWFAFVFSNLLSKPYVVYLAQPIRLLYPRAVDRQNGIRIRQGDHKALMAMKRLAGWLIGWADRTSVRNAAIILTNGQHVSDWIRRLHGLENRPCPAGCHPMPSESINYPSRWQGNLELNDSVIPKPYVLLTNRHSPMKRFEYALWALKAIRRELAGLSLVITGQPTEYTDQLRYLVSGLGLEKAVHFVGLVTEEQLGRLYREAAVYVYPSPEEDYGMGIVEAMAAGTPVVAWNNGGPTVTVRDGETGYLVEPYNTDQFAERLLRLAKDPVLSEKMGRAGYQRARDLFSFDRHNELLEGALLEALGAKQEALQEEESTTPAVTFAR